MSASGRGRDCGFSEGNRTTFGQKRTLALSVLLMRIRTDENKLFPINQDVY